MTTSHAAAVDAYAGELQLDMVVGSSNVAAVRAAGGVSRMFERGCSLGAGGEPRGVAEGRGKCSAASAGLLGRAQASGGRPGGRAASGGVMTTSHAAAVDAYAGELQLDQIKLERRITSKTNNESAELEWTDTHSFRAVYKQRKNWHASLVRLQSLIFYLQ